MGLTWEESEAVAQAALASIYGELVRIEPRTTSDYAGSRPDPLRPVKTVTGIPSSAVDNMHLKGTVRGGEETGGTRIAAASVEVWLPRWAVAQIDYQIRRGDAVALIERPGRPRYTITRLYTSIMGCLTLYLASEPQ